MAFCAEVSRPVLRVVTLLFHTPAARASLPLPRTVCHTLPLLLQLLDVSRREMGKLRGSVKDAREHGKEALKRARTSLA